MEYRSFRELCGLATEYEDRSDLIRLSIVEGELRDKNWSWAGASLKDYMESYVALRLDSDEVESEEVEIWADSALRLVWRAVAEAEQLVSSREEEAATKVLALNPRVAVTRAVEGILRQDFEGA